MCVCVCVPDGWKCPGVFLHGNQRVMVYADAELPETNGSV